MRGEVLDFIELTNEGLISGDDGGRYTFTRADVQQGSALRSGAKVDFVPVGTTATQIYPVAAAAPGPATSPAAGLAPATPTPAAPRYDGPGEPDMSPLDYFVKCLRKYVDGEGRARRKEYWSFFLFEIVFFIPVWILHMIAMSMALGSGGGAGAIAGSGMFLLVTLVAMLAGLALLLPGICVSIRRMHDIGLTGWILLVGLVPFIGGIALLVMSLLPSQEGPNQYGPYPKPTAALRPAVA